MVEMCCQDSALKQKLNSDEQALNILKRELLNLQKECNYYQKLFDLYGSSNEKVIDIIYFDNRMLLNCAIIFLMCKFCNNTNNF